jgi:hypothetical protein
MIGLDIEFKTLDDIFKLMGVIMCDQMVYGL